MKTKPRVFTPLGLIALSFVVGGLLFFLAPTTALSFFALAAGLLAAVAWWGSQYRRMTVTVHRKWYTSRSIGEASGGALHRLYTLVRTGHEYHFVTCQGEALVTRAVYHRVEEGGVLNVIAKPHDGDLHVVWPLF